LGDDRKKRELDDVSRRAQRLDEKILRLGETNDKIENDIQGIPNIDTNLNDLEPGLLGKQESSLK